MPYTSIMVHLDTSPRAFERAAVAARIAAAHQCRLIGLFATFEPDPAWFYLVDRAAECLEADRQRHREVREGVRRRFEAVAEGLAPEIEWRAVEGFPTPAVLAQVREADLVVAGQYDPGDPAGFIAPQFLETLILESGRPVLVVPHAGRFPQVGRRVMVAWNDSREATRALHDALPLMAQAQVRIASAQEPGSERPAEDACVHAARVLAARRIAHDLEHLTIGGDVEIGTQLLSRAADSGADLIVMGAYGHGRLRELVVGGVTRTLLQSMTIPVLLSH